MCHEKRTFLSLLSAVCGKMGQFKPRIFQILIFIVEIRSLMWLLSTKCLGIWKGNVICLFLLVNSWFEASWSQLWPVVARGNEIFNIFVSSLWCRGKARRWAPPLNMQCFQNSCASRTANALELKVTFH